jgi:hypothetical protein
MEQKPKVRPEVSIAIRTAKTLALISLLFQIAEPLIVNDHNFKGTSWLSLFFLLTFGSYALIARRRK